MSRVQTLNRIYIFKTLRETRNSFIFSFGLGFDSEVSRLCYESLVRHVSIVYLKPSLNLLFSLMLSNVFKSLNMIVTLSKYFRQHHRSIYLKLFFSTSLSLLSAHQPLKIFRFNLIIFITNLFIGIFQTICCIHRRSRLCSPSVASVHTIVP